MRGVPDVAYSGALEGGVLVVFSPFGAPSLFIVAGTSAGVPQWSALTAIADQKAGKRLGGINATIYDSARDGSTAFHDVRTGNNIVAGLTGYEAAPGWDPVTGWGTPNAGLLVPLLAAAGPDLSEGH
jgi:subtilase family serine protease